MKRLLMVVYQFPPSASVAAHRPHKFARYLPDFGWKPAVLCRTPDPMYPQDPSFLKELSPDLPVDRITPSEPLRLTGLLGRFGAAIRRWVSVPDERRGWKKALRKEIPKAIGRHRPDALYVSSVPLSSLAAAVDAAERAGIPFIADFHNEWTRNMYYDPPTRWHDRAQRRLERRVVESARAVVTLNPLHTEDLEERFPGRIYGTVENGFEPADFEGLPPPPRRERPVLTYAGAVYGHQNPEPLLDTLAGIGADVEVRILGDPFRQFAEKSRPFPVHVERNVPHSDLARRLADSDAFFLCLAPEAARQLPAKLYEYMAAGRPTLALVPSGGAAAELVRRTSCGTVVPSERKEEWGEGVRSFLSRLKDQPGPSGFLDDAIRACERRTLTQKLASILDRAV